MLNCQHAVASMPASSSTRWLASRNGRPQIRRRLMQATQVTRRLALTGTAAAIASAIPHNSAAAGDAIWFHEYSAIKQRDGNSINLAMYRKRLGAPQSGAAPRPVLFVVHGSSMS